MRFEFIFEKTYEIALLDEIPVGLYEKVHYPGGASGDKSGLPLLIKNKSGQEWIGVFEDSGESGINAVLGCPAPDQVFVIVSGTPYWLDTAHKRSCVDLPKLFVRDFLVLGTEQKIILVDWTNIFCFGETGFLWDSKLDYGIQNIEQSGRVLKVTGIAPGGTVPWLVSLRLEDGSVLAN